MTPQENIDLLIRKFSRGQLSEKELDELELLKQTDPNIKKQIDDYQMLSAFVNESKLIDIKNIATKAHQKAIKRNDIIKKAVVIGSVATIAFLGIAIVWYTNTEKQTILTPTDTIKKNNKSKPNNVTEKTVGLAPKGNTIYDSQEKSIVQHKPVTNHTSSKDSIQKQLENTFVDNKIIEQPTTTQKTNTLNKATTTPRQDSTMRLDTCKKVTLQADFSVQSTCKEEQTGSITLNRCSGGYKPYHFQVYDMHHNPSDDFTHLEAGHYKILITDTKGCTSWKEIIVPEKSCQTHYTINPFIGETWETPKKDKKGHLKIVDKKGNIYFSQNLAPAEILLWDGKSNNGDIKSGYYLFYIQYEDNSMTNGTVTIIE